MENIKLENNYINKEQEQNFYLLLHFINQQLQMDGKGNITSLMEDLLDGEPGTPDKLTIGELGGILIGEMEEIFNKK